jgi:hypothetical protein
MASGTETPSGDLHIHIHLDGLPAGKNGLPAGKNAAGDVHIHIHLAGAPAAVATGGIHIEGLPASKD